MTSETALGLRPGGKGVRTASAPTPVLPAPTAASPTAPAAASTEAPRLAMLLACLLAVRDGRWGEAERALAGGSEVARRDAACLNLHGIICQARGEWKQARRSFGAAMRADRGFAPARHNMRRLYELDTFGATRLPIALVDGRTLAAIGRRFE